MLRRVIDQADHAMTAPPDRQPSLEQIIDRIAKKAYASEGTVKRIIQKRRRLRPDLRRAGRPKGRRDVH
jgi:hypothetical protein